MFLVIDENMRLCLMMIQYYLLNRPILLNQPQSKLGQIVLFIYTHQINFDAIQPFRLCTLNQIELKNCLCRFISRSDNIFIQSLMAFRLNSILIIRGQTLAHSQSLVLNGQTILVVSIGHFCAFYAVLFPREYIPNTPLHSTYIIVFLCTFGRLQRGRFIQSFLIAQCRLNHKYK